VRRLVLLALVAPLLAACGGAVGPTAQETLVSEITQEVPHWITAERLPESARAGAHLFAVAGCTACHNYLGVGGGGLLGAPDLTAEGSRNSSITFQIAHLKNPSAVHPGSPMPPFASLGERRLTQLAIFLVDSTGLQ
jgi:mono/diheme cytochrome c family protein